MTEIIRKVAGVVIRERKLLLVRKRGTGVFLSPGGKPENGETPFQTLARELREEAGLLLVGVTHMGQYGGMSPFGDEAVLIDVYDAHVVGTPQPGREIEELLWVGGDYARHGIEVGSVFAHNVIPALVRDGLVDDRSHKTHFLPASEPGRPRVFVFDLDGTLVFGNQPLHPSIERSLRTLLAKGHEAVFATARAPRGVRHVLPGSLLGLPTLLCNGALCHVGGREVFRRPFDRRLAREVACVLADNRLSFQLEFGDHCFLWGDVKRFEHQLAYNYQPPKGGLDAQPFDGILKIVIAPGPGIMDCLGLLRDFLGDVAVFNHDDQYVELTSRGVNKFSSFDRLMRHNERMYVIYVVSIGNDYNDFEMLVNASEAVIVGRNLFPLRHVCTAKFVTPESEQIARIIEEYA
jgi:HAD superfamily hydrolase (TIGR01484 family)